MATRRPSLNTPFSLSNFKSKLEELTVNPENKDGEQGLSFIRGNKLTTWLESPATPDDSVSHTALLLDGVFPDRDQPLPISEDEILNGDEKCPMMFCILLEMDQGNLVSDLHKNGINDARLPMPLQQLQGYVTQALPSLGTTAHTDIIRDFDDKQWKYFPLRFTHGMRPLPIEPIRLPICMRSLINGKGGTAELHMIAVPEEFLDAKLKAAVPSSAFQHERYGKCYQFALKNFNSASYRLFEAEIQAYHHLRNQRHMIRCFGGFSHFGHAPDRKTHSILLEYGECDLAEYFALVNPPALPEDVDAFWIGLFNVVAAAKEIHSHKAPRGGRVMSYDGWHGDIKPDNILLIDKGLKLADPGFVNFARSKDNQNEDGVPRVLHGWTSTYGPPEVDENNSAVHEPWAVDIWSIGCVLSEAATWVVLAGSGRVAYSRARQQAIADLRSPQHQQSPAVRNLGDGDFFHNGTTVLSTVTQWHAMLRGLVRPQDEITKHVLDLIDQHLLVQEPRKRLRADLLCTRFAEVQEATSRSRLNDSTPPLFRRLIQKTRKEALEKWISESQILEGLSVEDRKACPPTRSALFTHFARHPEPRRSALAPLAQQTSRTSMGTVNGHVRRTTCSHHVHQSSVDAPVGTSPPDKPPDGLTVFDSFYQRKASEPRLGNLFSKSHRKSKDKLLAAYYDQRDIVFLVDNAASMRPVWSEVKFTLLELTDRARNQDEDGLDLMFTRSAHTISKAKHDASKLFSQLIASEEVYPHNTVTTDMTEKLGGKLFAWLDSFRANPDSYRKMTIIVLTDGRWNCSSDENEYEVDDMVIRWAKEAKQCGVFRVQRRPVSIQFVSFGHDPLALARLQRLDDRLRYYDIEDIIDTEPSSGNINKMLLGSFVPDIDEINTVPSSLMMESLSPVPSSDPMPPHTEGSRNPRRQVREERNAYLYRSPSHSDEREEDNGGDD